ncbi:HIT family protein [Halocatena halophila]|uniref:HIT family protein n=1 Tax=Halocatena halophila TaxID=2814576 RepID=UPI002ED183C8
MTNTTSTDDCVFCRIATGTERAQIVLRSATSCAFLDHAPAAPGHVLVIPTEHVETLPAMEPERAGALFETVQHVSDAIDRVCSPDGISIIQSNGRAAGQEVFHAHVHVIPRSVDDQITLSWEPTPADPNGAIAEGLERELA